MTTRVFVSFDYELSWGTYEMTTTAYASTNVIRANEAASALVALHERMQFPATWAVVGAAADLAPIEVRLARCAAIGAPVERLAPHLAAIEETRRGDCLNIPEATLAALVASRVQELGSHTYAHGYADVLSEEAWERDFSAFRELRLDAHALFVAPKNLVTRELIAMARAEGFANVRVNPDNWLYRMRSRQSFLIPLIRLLRIADALLPINELFIMLAGERGAASGTLVGNFFFRPALRWEWLDRLHLLRFQIFSLFAMATGRDVHLWSHPHNYGVAIVRSLKNHERVLQVLLALAAQGRVRLARCSEA